MNYFRLTYRYVYASDPTEGKPIYTKDKPGIPKSVAWIKAMRKVIDTIPMTARNLTWEFVEISGQEYQEGQ